ncbi:MAG: hypothetical protein IJI44_03975 [Erysipelotrichaceae bacterium]|nr:hypothetical protein [Erysipelotrichaceae bacterium]
MSLIGTSIKSKLTGINGIITGIDKKNISVTFTYGGIISVPLQRHEDLLTMSEEARDELKEYIDSFKRSRKQAV